MTIKLYQKIEYLSIFLIKKAATYKGSGLMKGSSFFSFSIPV